MVYVTLFLYSLLCALVGFLAAVKIYDECEKSTENLLRAHREYEEALRSGYEYLKKVVADQEEIISQLRGGSYDNR